MTKQQNNSIQTHSPPVFLAGSIHTAAPVHKLEQLTQTTPAKDYSPFTARARSKFIQENWLKALAKVDSPLKKNYTFALKCSSVIKQSGKKFTALYCGNRFCLICNRIRTAQLINGYEKPLEALNDKQFLTLTRPNVKASELKEEINTYYQIWRVIMRKAVKEGKHISGVRKLEITYNPTRDDYHPHFHIIVNTRENAEYLREKWLENSPQAVIEAQDITVCTGYKEIFKYVTKMTTKTSKAKTSKSAFYPLQTDWIFQCIKGARIFQPFGEVKKVEVSEDIETTQALVVESAEENTTVYTWEGDDWYKKIAGGWEPLSDFVPTKKQIQYRDRIIYKYFDTSPI